MNKRLFIPPIIDLDYHRSIIKAELSYYEFFKQAWPIMEGNTPFIDGWHIQAICEHLEACYERTIKKLLINVPPRSAKSTLASIAFPVWVWIHNSEEKFMYGSYATSLSIDHSLKCRRLIESNWYQERWGHLYQLAKDQKAKSFFENNKGGHRIATSVGAATTGKGASILIGDDLNNVKDGDSEVKKESTLSWFNHVASTRLNNPETGVQIIIQQRTASNDISGDIMANDTDKKWVYLIIPLEYEENRKAKTIVLPTTNGKVWEDPRTIEGETICEKRWTPEVIQNYKTTLGSREYAGQMQQRPASVEGDIFKKSWFKWWKYSTPPEIEFTLQSWDTALTVNSTSAYSACTTWGIFRDHNYVENIILLSMWKGRLEYPELRKMVKRLYFDYRDNGKERNPKFQGRQIDMCLIEGKASGDPLIQDLVTAGIRAIAFDPNNYSKRSKDKTRTSGGKEFRASLVAPLIEGGLVWLPAKPPNYDRLLPYADNFLETVITFPSPQSNDIVDTMTQAFLKLKSGRYILNPRDERPIPPSSYQKVEVY